MGLTRRQAVFAGLGTLVLGGCSASGSSRQRPSAWTDYIAGPTSRSRRYADVPPPAYPNQPGVATPARHTPQGIDAVARIHWTPVAPKQAKVNPMHGVDKITVHHEGAAAVRFTDFKSTAKRIEAIRNVHTRDRRWGDIGYHYIVDRAGRVWEGRPMQYQGAHVKNHNEHNIGILMLGNFDKQSPTDSQLQSLFATAAQLKRRYNVKPSLVRSHQEINPTSCPGKRLQPYMNGLRSHVG